MSIRRTTPLLLAAGLAAAAVACDAGGAGADGPGGGSSVATSAAQARDTAVQAGDRAAAEGGRELTTIRVAGIPVRVEVADEDSERQRGLMYRDSLPPDQGMLFVYPEQRTLSFWMRNTRIPLSIAFVDRRGVIVDIQQMDPNTEKLHRSRQPAMYALEMARGWFEEHGVEEGDRVRF